ncbi:YkvA family protein [Paenibacillus terrigena]|uniref:YkvA family protein n=1 Tax=Paenibacillus terrigena TaxID=369333 RepID=UPI0028D2E56C|nr:YkvA family protein [Paenibacillus terrigena]
MKKDDDSIHSELSLQELPYSQENEEMVKKNFWTKTKKFAGKIPFTKDAVAMYYCAVDAKTPLWAKGIAFGALAYFISPVDAIPDALIGLGFTDDAAVIVAGIKAISGQITDDHREQADNFLHGDDKKAQP